MPNYMTRVELHHATEEDYETLHAAMEAQGFERTITSAERRVYHLPTAEYYRATNLQRGQVLESAKAAATTTGRRYAVVVTESNGLTWFGLEEVR
jgi:hypothetical protein